MEDSQEQQTAMYDQPAEPAPSLIGNSPLFPRTDPPETRIIIVCVWNAYTSAFEPTSSYRTLEGAIDSAVEYLVHGHAVCFKTIVPELPSQPVQW